MLANLSLRALLLSGFLAVALLLALLGLESVNGVNQVDRSVDKVTRAAPMIDAAMEMKLSVRHDMQLIMELLAAGDKQELAEVWKEHEAVVAQYDAFSNAILKGAVTEEGEIYATDDPVLQRVVHEADVFHNDEFLPLIGGIHKLMQELFALHEAREMTMQMFEESFDSLVKQIKALEEAVKERIPRRIAEQTPMEEIYSHEVMWADMVSEIRNNLTEYRISMEEMAQQLDEAQMRRVRDEMARCDGEMIGWFNALKKGAATVEGDVAPMTDPALLALLEPIMTDYKSVYKDLAGRYGKLLLEVNTAKGKMSALDADADAVGEKMMETLGGVEDGARGVIEAAKQQASDTAGAIFWTVLIMLVIGVALAVTLGQLITRRVLNLLGCEPTQMLQVAERVANGDLAGAAASANGQTKGAFAELMRMVENLRTGFQTLREHALTLSQAASALSSASSQLANSSTEMKQSAVSSAAAVKQSTENLQSISGAVEHLSANMQNIAGSVEQISASMNGVSSASEEASVNLSSVSHSSAEVTNNMRVAREAAEQTETSIGSVAQAVDGISQTIVEVKGQCQQASDESARANQIAAGSVSVMHELSHTANEIGNVIAVISNIAEQTNMLALNASIEAAGAGESGKGFAVVANEVKALASQTGDATKMIADQVEAIRSQTQQVGAANEEVTDAIGRLREANDGILMAMQEQTHTMGGVAREMANISDQAAQMSQRVQESFGGLEEANRSVEEISIGIEDVSRNVAETTSGVTEVSSNVSEASSGSREISGSVTEAAQAANEIANGMDELRGHASQVSEVSHDVHDQAQLMSRVAGELDEMLARYKV
ncbi:methyl-accepting chemotaxis protein [Magnetofaba australis]|nr:methyl-accepting chemotaxis protein [Magnetofaba australis]